MTRVNYRGDGHAGDTEVEDSYTSRHSPESMDEELLHHLARLGGRGARALDLVMNSVLGGRDAVHAATALSLGFDDIVSADRDFDAVPGLRRIAPADVPTA